MLKITRLETFVIGDGPEIDPNKGGVEPLVRRDRTSPESPVSPC